MKREQFESFKSINKKEKLKQNTLLFNTVNIIAINAESLMKNYLDDIKKGIVESLPSIIENSRQTYILSCNSIVRHICDEHKDNLKVSNPSTQKGEDWIKNIQANGTLDIRRVFMYIKNICEKSIIKYSNKVKFNILFISRGLPSLSTIRNESFLFTAPINESDASKERANKRFSAFLKKHNSVVNAINLIGKDDSNSNLLTDMGKTQGSSKNVGNKIEIVISINEMLNIGGYTNEQIVVIAPFLMFFLIKTVAKEQQNNSYVGNYKIPDSQLHKLLTLMKCMYQLTDHKELLLIHCRNEKEYDIYNLISLLFIEGFEMFDKNFSAKHDDIWATVALRGNFLKKDDLIIIKNFFTLIKTIGGLRELIIEFDNNNINDVIRITFGNLELNNQNIIL